MCSIQSEQLETLRKVPIASIDVGSTQPRRHFARDEIQRLASSIRTVGLIHPLVVQPLESGKYVLIAGERRLRAVHQIGWTHVPVLLRPYDGNVAAQVALIENIQRVELNPLEVARALHKLGQEHKMTQRQLAAALGKRRSTIANYLRLLALPTQIQDKLREGEIGLGHAKALLSVQSAQQQMRLLRRVLREKLSVRQTETFAREKQSSPHLEKNTSLFIKDLEAQLQKNLGTRVQIHDNNHRGQIRLHYHDLDELDDLLQRLGIQPDLEQ